MIVLAPGWTLWNVAAHAPWLTRPVIDITEMCVIATALLVLLAWFKRAGVRCVLAIASGLAALVLIHKGIALLSYVPRPFVAFHFRPLYPHARDTSFPSDTTGYFAVVAVPMLLTWRRLGWIAVAITVEVGFGCAFVGVHYLTDVVGGAAIGGATAWLSWWMLGLRSIAPLVSAVEGAAATLHLRVQPST